MTDDLVRNNIAENRYELQTAGKTAIIVYRQDGDVVTFRHTEVPPELAGHGVGSKLVAGAFQDLRDRGLMARVECPFIAAYVQRHPETRDLIADGAGSPAEGPRR